MRPSPPRAVGRITAHPPHAAPGQAIGLLGGSFNPPHIAHRMISELVLRRLGLAKVWWIVSPGNPLKRRADTAPLAERLVLCRDIAKSPHIVVTGFEADLGSPYTASTLAFLKAHNPLVRFVWIMGADNLASIERWRCWREIFTMVPVAVVDRPGWRLKALASKAARAFADSRVPEAEARGLAKRPPPAWTFLTGPLSRVSSTALRRAKRQTASPGRGRVARDGPSSVEGKRGGPAKGLDRRGGKRLSIGACESRGVGESRAARPAAGRGCVGAAPRRAQSGPMMKGRSAHDAKHT